ncbi:restriction endonuclease subunit S [Serratia rubidaea]|uniref:restriction endonuclease subunit S n=1 Tax=Serratia rubidaea TaxID=61652 RepID=UPI0023B1CD66|nr:restriction endonuclease subunit S [Serratia rubidaea]MDK1704613.1 restriction endonuclease subunit S [Serratia rubidaea]
MSWPMVKLGDVLSIIRGVTFKPNDQVEPLSEGSTIVMRTKNVQRDGLDISDLIAIPDSFIKRDEQYLRSEDMLISSANSWELVGKISFIEKLPAKSTAGGFISIIRAKKEKVIPKYLYYWLTLEHTQVKIRNCGQKTTNISNLNLERFKELFIPLPSLNDQRRIVAILDKAANIRQKREQAIKLADDFLRTKFLDMFSNEKIKKYSIVKIDDLLAQDKNSIRTGPFGSQLLHSEFTESGIAVLGIDNAVKNEFQWGKPRFISPNKYETLKRYTVLPGDVIITIMGTCGRCAVVPDDIPVAINTKHLCCISLNKDKCAPEFLHSYFLTHPLAKEYLAKHSKGAIMDGLNMGIIKHMSFPEIPLEQQYEFVNIKKKIKRFKSKLNSSKIDCEYNFATLCNDIFSMRG